MDQALLDDNEILRLMAYSLDLSGIKLFAQLISDPTKFVYLGPPEWSFIGFVDTDFVTGVILEHGFESVLEELTFKYQDREKFLKTFKI